MRSARTSSFPLDRPFEKLEPTTSLSEAGLRLVLDFYSDNATVIGTATVLTGNLVITAKHVIAELFNGPERHLAALQVLPGPVYVVWDVFQGWACVNADLALLHLATNPGRSDGDKTHAWRVPRVRALPPAPHSPVAAFGYRRSTIRVSTNQAGGPHIDLNDEPMMAVGRVGAVHDPRRDAVMLPFPCYEVGARFDAGMSGGPVFDETGCLCGIICSNFDGSHIEGPPVSYVSSLWPVFSLGISANRGDKYPRDVMYPVIDLVRGGLVRVVDLEELEQRVATSLSVGAGSGI